MSKQMSIEHLVKFPQILGKLETTTSQDLITTSSQDLITVNAINQAKEMKKQTAVEWFSDNAWKLTSKLISKEITLGRYAVLYFELHNQAKEMEKEQQEMAFNEALDIYSDCSFEEYYNETYKKEEK